MSEAIHAGPQVDAPLRAVAVVGPTAAGKSELSMQLGEQLGLALLCCDSVQIYRGLDIGSAKPSASDRARVPHRLLDLVDPDAEFSAGEYGRLAREELAKGPAIFCGGTGLYLRAAGWTHSGQEEDDAARNLDHGPERESFERLWLDRESSDPGCAWRALDQIDPVTAGQIHPKNVVRTLRALWLCTRHGEPVSAVRAREPMRPLIDLLMIVLDPGVAAVDEAIDRRVETMLEAGWVAEVEKLRAAGYDARHKAMRSLGYRELLEHLAGAISLAQATQAIQAATRRYARRQRTYFRHQFRNLLPTEQIVHMETANSCRLVSPLRDMVAAFLDRRPA